MMVSFSTRLFNGNSSVDVIKHSPYMNVSAYRQERTGGIQRQAFLATFTAANLSVALRALLSIVWASNFSYGLVIIGCEDVFTVHLHY